MNSYLRYVESCSLTRDWSRPPLPSALGAWSLSRWTTREVFPILLFFSFPLFLSYLQSLVLICIIVLTMVNIIIIIIISHHLISFLATARTWMGAQQKRLQGLCWKLLGGLSGRRKAFFSSWPSWPSSWPSWPSSWPSSVTHLKASYGGKRASLLTQMVRNLPAKREIQVRSLGQKDPLDREWQPLQYSCLENFMERGAWRAALSVGSQRVGHDSATDTCGGG